MFQYYADTGKQGRVNATALEYFVSVGAVTSLLASHAGVRSWRMSSSDMSLPMSCIKKEERN